MSYLISGLNIVFVYSCVQLVYSGQPLKAKCHGSASWHGDSVESLGRYTLFLRATLLSQMFSWAN